MTRFATAGWPLTFLLMGMLLLITGCSDDDDPVQVTLDPTVESRTPELLMENFRIVHETRDAEQYMALLDPDFRFILREETAARYPDLGAAIEFAEEERIQQRMFSGEGVTDPGGVFRPAVKTVSFSRFRALDTWRASDDPVNFPESDWAPFEVVFLFDCGQEFSTHEVTGVAKFYVRRYSRLVEGKETPYYKLAGVVDLTQSDKGVERTPWGLIKAYYR